MIASKLSNVFTIRFLFSFIYAAALSLIPNSSFVDFDNYLDYASDSSVHLVAYSQSLLAFFANEPLWLLLNNLLFSFLTDQITVRVIIFLSSFIVSFAVLGLSNKSNFLFLLLLLFLPSVVKNYLIHIRQGLASSLFILGFLSPSDSRKRYFCWIAPLIHSSFFIIVFVQFFSRLLLRFKSQIFHRLVPLSVFLLSTSLSFTFFASLVGARQASTYSSSSFNVSSFSFLIWALVTFIYLSEGPPFVRLFWTEISLILFFLSTYWFSPLSSRIFEGVFLLSLLPTLSLSSYRFTLMILICFFVFFIAYWYTIYPSLFVS